MPWNDKVHEDLKNIKITIKKAWIVLVKIAITSTLCASPQAKADTKLLALIQLR